MPARAGMTLPHRQFISFFCCADHLFIPNEHFVLFIVTHNRGKGEIMTDSEKTRDPMKRGTLFVNHEALNTWLRFGTPIPPVERGERRPLAGAELLRWAGQRARNHKTLQLIKKE
jgi:hypothetical protein